MKILIISLFGLSSSGREANLVDITFKECEINGITSDFSHARKEYKNLKEEIRGKGNITLLHVPAYKKNISLKRIYSHLIFARLLRKQLRNLKFKPDLIYCMMPTSTAAYVAGKFCKKHDIPFIIDVIDIWPDSLIPIVSFKKIIELIVFPWRYLTHKAYKMADYISGESKKYAKIAHEINPQVPFSYTYLGVDSSLIKQLVEESRITLDKPKDEIWLAYGGSLGQSYDFDVILEGLKYLSEEKISYKMWFIGDGENASYIKNYALKNNLNIEITGRLPYKDLLKYLSYCDIAINSFKEGTLVVHSYKFNDYIATGCFVLNNLLGETADMIENYKVGFNFNSRTFKNVLKRTIYNWDIIKPELSNNFQTLINRELDSITIYKRLGKDIKNQILGKKAKN